MKGTQLGEFEELVLLVVGVLFPEAYGLNIREEIINQTKRKVAIGAVHSALSRLDEKGFLESELAEGTHERGGRRKRLFKITASGKQALERNHELRNSLFNQIPEMALKIV
ncbi:PadR family transcriptional regulator [Roseivirga echinicomitans]|uniref:PadR family transcriptional regulator n=1 Tax=Roseivirga echinicomitans TaxID=296218 RepID=A0A150XXL0_9BACT|nr:helix-turn-helix transcriptional regulator [Roseivirga echinicomitans]KYG83500.1 PadR family transcriptional regulator [Roseivirga echinicomitans]